MSTQTEQINTELLKTCKQLATDLKALADYHLPESHPDSDLANESVERALVVIAKAETPPPTAPARQGDEEK